MIRVVALVLPFISLSLFPWPLTVLLAILAGWYEPLIPVSIGLLADMLYMNASVSCLPVWSLAGVLVSAVTSYVRSQMRTGMMY